MLALDRGDACRGMAFHIPAAEVRSELPLIWVRERATGAYAAKWVSVETEQGTVPAITFVADREHPLYAGPLPEEQAASLITKASGRLGTCVEYLLSTADHLKEIGLSDPHLEDLAARVRDNRDWREIQQAAD
jgi:cation transport protein ChaC